MGFECHQDSWKRPVLLETTKTTRFSSGFNQSNEKRLCRSLFKALYRFVNIMQGLIITAVAGFTMTVEV